MSLPANWTLKGESESASLKRGGSAEQSEYRSIYVVDCRQIDGGDPLSAHAHFSAQLDGRAGVIQGKYGEYVFNYDSYNAKHLGEGFWEVEARFVTAGGGQQPAGGGGGGSSGGGGSLLPIGVVRTVSYDSTGGTQRITSAYSETKYGENAPGMSLAINVNGDSVEGVDVVVPVFEWTEEYELPARTLTDSYVKTVADMTGTTNTKKFRGFDAGEVLFLGVSGTQVFNPNQQLITDAVSTRISFRFAAKKTRKNLLIASVGVIPTIKGWDYLWIRYAPNQANGIGLQTPVAAYVNRVYEESDFGLLRLP
jgi:hypothetical protein